MIETREMKLADRTFNVPMLPFKVTRRVYPLCRRLTTQGLVDRAIASNGVLDVDEQGMDDVAEVVFLCAQAADWEFTREQFELLPISPPELLDAFMVARYQTGAWREVAQDVDGAAPGEEPGEASPPK